MCPLVLFSHHTLTIVSSLSTKKKKELQEEEWLCGFWFLLPHHQLPSALGCVLDSSARWLCRSAWHRAERKIGGWLVWSESQKPHRRNKRRNVRRNTHRETRASRIEDPLSAREQLPVRFERFDLADIRPFVLASFLVFLFCCYSLIRPSVTEQCRVHWFIISHWLPDLAGKFLWKKETKIKPPKKTYQSSGGDLIDRNYQFISSVCSSVAVGVTLFRLRSFYSCVILVAGEYLFTSGERAINRAG